MSAVCATAPTAGLAGVAPWARTAAHAVSVLTIPSGLWRVALVAGLPVMDNLQWKWWERPWVLFLSVISEALALLTLGLVQRWGEVVPGWIPLVGNRRVPPLAAVIPAALGSVALTLLWGMAFYNAVTGTFFDTFGGPVQRCLVAACYAPLLAWGPLLAAVTIAYYRRRSGANALTT